MLGTLQCVNPKPLFSDRFFHLIIDYDQSSLLLWPIICEQREEKTVISFEILSPLSPNLAEIRQESLWSKWSACSGEDSLSQKFIGLSQKFLWITISSRIIAKTPT